MAYNDDYSDGGDTPEQPDPYAPKRDAVGQWYKQYTGRDGSAGEIDGWARNSNFGSVQGSIQNSDEAKAYAAKPAAGAAPASTAQQWNREQFRDEWLGTGSDKARQDALLARDGLTLDASGRARLRSGETMDLRLGAKAGGTQATWTGVAGGEQKTGQAAGSGGGFGALMGGGSSSMSLSTGGNIPAGASDELYKMLLARAKQSTTIDRNDPNVRGQADAYSANEERSKRNYLADLAEKQGPMANLQGEQRLAAERVGQRSGAFESELMGRELTSRRSEIENALKGMQGFITQEQQLALTKELGLLDNAIKQQGLALQGQEINLRGRGMDMQNDQFMRNLGLQEADRGAYWDALRSGLI